VQADVYEAAALAAASTINIASLPKDAIVLGNSFVEWDDLTMTAGTISCGIAGAVAQFFAATVPDTALERFYFNAIAAIHYRCLAVTPIILTTATETATGTIVTEVLYAIE
jgi:hypothetical protein